MPNPVDSLDAPIDWRDPELWPILSDLQGNILKGHGRNHTQNICLRFDPDRVGDVRKAIRSLAANVTSALTQLRETSVFKIVGRPGGTAVYLAISAAGYRAIGLTPPGNPAFLAGMAARAADLHDPDAATWEAHLRGIHAVLIVADDSHALVGNAAALLTAGLADAGITILGRDAGRAPRPTGVGAAKARGRRQLGSDARNQPLLLAEDVAAVRSKEKSFLWDPGFSPRDCALVRDPHGAFGDSFGSYLVYRKLERNVAGSPLRDDVPALAAISTSSDSVSGATAQFPAAIDATGSGRACPSPVRDADRPQQIDGAGALLERERPRLMPRRGIPYGEGAEPCGPDRSYPARGTGLLFMAYNADICRQFEFTRKSWINNAAELDQALAHVPMAGIDFDPAAPDAIALRRWLRAGHEARPDRSMRWACDDFGTLKGGEYLFAPSLSALAAL